MTAGRNRQMNTPNRRPACHIKAGMSHTFVTFTHAAFTPTFCLNLSLYNNYRTSRFRPNLQSVKSLLTKVLGAARQTGRTQISPQTDHICSLPITGPVETLGR
ncbi:MAG: hypothetical protein ABW059_04730 [Dehalococcoides mccartyi]